MRFFIKNIHRSYHYHKFYHGSGSPAAKILADCTVDLRSDTVTKPCDHMRNAMRDAPVGDDVQQEDETILELENKMAEISGKDAGLFVASGTMGNLLSILVHCNRRGGEVLLGDRSHVFTCEQANIAQFGGIQSYILPTRRDGTFCMQDLESKVHDDDFHYPSTELICIENTHGSLGGKVLPLQWLDEVATLAAEKGLPLHMDGARIFNASIASGVPVARLLKGVHSASICLSKSLGAPLGTVIVGDEAFIQRARRLRKALGGGWRQAGIVAAGGLYALNHNVERLSEDHDHAQILAKGINEMKHPNIFVNLEDVQTNIILVEMNPEAITPDEFSQRIMSVSDEEGAALGRTTSVLASPYKRHLVRMVTHLDVSRPQTEAALAKVQFVMKSVSTM